ncbi:hypothetical protein [Microvirga puerhi]|uniref:Uncharacterized protein n=1 Tax=Microvirga puerhi TaxID=2876078 RepID=A0ABS7VLK7_9HYPH|nr:hypothetical protein [Microvirga puerhi]MBZ6076413.1 hypothetical protein [Microvirga puerhi]
MLLSILAMAGCVQEAPSLVFDTARLSQAEWERIQSECDYEAEKATASAPSSLVFVRWQRLYIGCIELRGIKYLGTTDQFPHLKRRTGSV